MKAIILSLFLSISLFAQGEFILLLQGSGTGGLDAPTNLLAVGDTGKITLTWTDPTGDAEKIYIYRDSSVTTPTTLLDSVDLAAETYVDTPLVAEGIWSYRLRARTDGYIYSGYTASVYDTVMGGGADTLGSNILNNSGFENELNFDTDWDNYWSPEADSVVRSNEQVYDGSYAAKIVASEANAGIIYVREGSFVPTEEGKTYWVEGYYYVVDGGSNIYATFVAGTTGALTEKDEWTYFSFSAEATGVAHPLLIQIVSSTATTFYLDNVTVKELLE
jgi:hypothetical protein